MDYIFTDSSRNNTAMLPLSGYIDIDIGGDNDFKVSIDFSEYDKDSMKQGGFIYCVGTEFGGLLNSFESDTSNNEVSFSGKSFRGMLDERYTEPPSGSDYLTVVGELNTVIKSICGANPFGGLFKVSTINTGVSVSDFKVGRYYSWLEAINQILKSKDYRINLEVKEDDNGGIVTFYVEISAVPIIDYSDEIENSQDGLIDFSISKKPSILYSHMILLGKGELKDRLVVKAKIDGDSLVEVTTIPDSINTRVYLYESSGTETKDVLLEEGTKKISEIIEKDSQKITLSDNMNVWLGDIVGGRDYITGTTISEPITKIIYKYKYGEESLSYTIGGQ